MNTDFSHTTTGDAITIIVIIFGIIAFILFACLAFYQHNFDRWIPAKKKKNLGFFRKLLPQLFTALAFFFLVLAVAFFKIII